VDNAAAGLSVLAPDVRVRASTAAGNGQLGIHGDGADRLVVADSVLRANNVERFSAMAASGGIKVTGSDGIVRRHNLVEDNRSHELWMDLGSDGARVVRNVSRRNTAAGIIIEMSTNEVVASNVTVDNDVGVIISETSGAWVWNNVLLGNVRSSTWWTGGGRRSRSTSRSATTSWPRPPAGAGRRSSSTTSTGSGRAPTCG
jgi:hypothetical protein